MDSRAMCRDLIGSLDGRLLSFYYQIPAFSTCTRGDGLLYRRGVHRPAGGPHRGQECVWERGLSVENMRPSSAARQVLTDWASNRLPHYADAERSAVRTVREEVLRQWKEEMGYEAVRERMESDPEVDRYAMQPIDRVFRTPNVQPEEDTLDYSCFLPAAERKREEEEEEEEEMEEDEEEVPELVDDEDEDAALLE